MAKPTPGSGGFTVPSSAGLITTQTFQGLTGGMNLSTPAHELPDTQARYMQDVLLDNLGIIRLRGPLTRVSTIPQLTGMAVGLTSMVAPDGDLGLALLTYSGTSLAYNILNSARTGWGGFTLGTLGAGAANSIIVDAKAAVSGEQMIGASAAYRATTPLIGLWGGSRKNNYATGTITTALNSTTVTGVGTSWSANVDAGMYVLNTSQALIGRVATVNSNTSITLEHNALIAVAGGAYQIVAVRQVYPRMAKGRITCGTNGTTVTGGDTKFTMFQSAQGWIGSSSTLHGLSWDLFRLPDYTFIGTVSGITNDTSLTLSANAAINMSNDRYVALAHPGILAAPLTSQGYVGFLTATYQGRQFYANNPNANIAPTASKGIARVWFSEPAEPEQIDMTDSDGDWFDVQSQASGTTPITALAGLQNALAIFKESELWAFLGTDPSNFQLRKIADTGTWSNGSVQVYRNMVIFASRLGIQGFDGVNVSSLSAELGTYWQNGVKLSTKTMRSMIHRDHYFLYVPDFNETYTRYKGATGVTPTSSTFVLNLTTGAITKFTNFGIGGATLLPPSFGLGSWFVGNDSTPITSVFDADSIFTTVGTDAIQLASDTSLGPDFYLETKKYDGKDAERKKLWKQLMMDYYVKGDTLSMDTVEGLTTAQGETASTSWPVQLDYTNARLKFLKRTTHIGFRLYETNGTVEDVQIGPWGLGFKYMRPGRV